MSRSSLFGPRFRPLPGARRGFTLIELLTVIAVIGILAAILIPTTSSARTAARKAKTRGQFSQWAAAIEAFRQEYGYYPTFETAGAGLASLLRDARRFPPRRHRAAHRHDRHAAAPAGAEYAPDSVHHVHGG
jgi:prepilin-type N-terminal cleavage/methylation domain-containing protein